MQYFGVADKEKRSSYDDVTTLEELKLLHLASLEREKWSQESFPVYENAVEQLYKFNPQGYANNLTKAWKFHYKMRLGLCKIADDQKNIGPTSCITEALKFAETAIRHACFPIASHSRARKLEKGKLGWFSAKQYRQKTGQKQ